MAGLPQDDPEQNDSYKSQKLQDLLIKGALVVLGLSIVLLSPDGNGNLWQSR